MSKLSDQIRSEAKKSRARDRSRKLTEHQNDLARSHGYKNFKDLISQEKASEVAERAQFAQAGLSDRDSPINGILPNNVEIFVRKDGRRGLRALEGFESGTTIFQELPYLWFNLQEDVLRIGLAWGLTRNIAVKFPKALPILQKKLKLRESFRPSLRSSDKKILERISKESRLSPATVRTIYNLVCTYNVIAQFHMAQEDAHWVGERISISLGLAYANHSCEPNSDRLETTSLSDFKSKLDGLYAIRDIQPGEEITWSYFHGEIPKGVKERQKALKREFGFYCNCARCLREQRKVIDRKEYGFSTRF